MFQVEEQGRACIPKSRRLLLPGLVFSFFWVAMEAGAFIELRGYPPEFHSTNNPCGWGLRTSNSIPKQAEATIVVAQLDQINFCGSLEGDCPPIQRDDGSGAYPSPHWNGEISHPVLYRAGATMKVSARFKVIPASFSGELMVRASGPFSIEIPETRIFAASGYAILKPTEASIPFPKQVDVLDQFVLNWDYRFHSNDQRTPAGSSTNQCYLTLERPLLSSNLFHTVIDISCRNAQKQTTREGIVRSIWLDFSRPGLPGVLKADRKTHMKYWGDFAIKHPIYHVANLVKFGDGRCEAWAELLQSALECQGIQDIELCEIRPPSTDIEMHSGPFRIWIHPQLRAQNNPNPVNLFVNHIVVTDHGRVYDPSYGKSYSTLQEWQNASVKAFMPIGGDKNHLAGMSLEKIKPRHG